QGVPHPHRTGAIGAGDPLAVRAEADRAHLAHVSSIRHLVPAEQVPDRYHTVDPGAGKAFAVRAERHVEESTRRLFQGEAFRAVRHTPNRHGRFAAAEAGQITAVRAEDPARPTASRTEPMGFLARADVPDSDGAGPDRGQPPAVRAEAEARPSVCL